MGPIVKDSKRHTGGTNFINALVMVRKGVKPEKDVYTYPEALPNNTRKPEIPEWATWKRLK